jgi:hypothetical protein
VPLDALSRRVSCNSLLNSSWIICLLFDHSYDAFKLFFFISRNFLFKLSLVRPSGTYVIFYFVVAYTHLSPFYLACAWVTVMLGRYRFRLLTAVVP